MQRLRALQAAPARRAAFARPRETSDPEPAIAVRFRTKRRRAREDACLESSTRKSILELPSNRDAARRLSEVARAAAAYPDASAALRAVDPASSLGEKVDVLRSLAALSPSAHDQRLQDPSETLTQ